ncbi:MAG TPA: DUF2569 domain-containing protein [Gemmatimonadales bacterium]|nr:DUF2569 domain-containing protein [Gemmatimonadales bacterium]
MPLITGTLRASFSPRTLVIESGCVLKESGTGALSRIWKLLTFSVTPPGAAATLATWLDPHEVNWSILLTGLLTLGIALVFAIRLPRLQPAGWPTFRPRAGAGGPSGLGGWLVVMAIGVIVLPLRVLLYLVRVAPTYTASSWARLTTPSGAAYHPLWAPSLLFELVCNLAILVFSGLQLWLFFRRNRLFPSVFIVFGVARVIIQLLDAVAVSSLPPLQSRATNEWSALASTSLGTALWVAYTLRSRRVRNTFVI